MANLLEDIQCAGFDTQPQLDGLTLASWKTRTSTVFVEGKNRMEGSAPATSYLNELRVYSDLSPEDKIGAAGYGGAQNRVGNANPGQARQIKCYNCNAQENGVALDEEQLLFLAGGQDNAVDEDVG
ncbi:hypothetical protein Tco_1329702 [Tanacetum coccineum]